MRPARFLCGESDEHRFDALTQAGFRPFRIIADEPPKRSGDNRIAAMVVAALRVHLVDRDLPPGPAPVRLMDHDFRLSDIAFQRTVGPEDPEAAVCPWLSHAGH